MSKLLSAYVGLEEKYALSTRELARRAEQMRIINEVGRRILSIRRLDDLLPFVTRVLYDTFNCYSVGVWLKEDASKALVMKAYADDGEDDGADQPLSFAYGERSVVVWVVEHGEPALVNDVDSDERYRSMPGSERVAAELAVPISLGGEIIGVLDIEHIEKDAFDPSDVELLITVADQVAIAIQNARLWEETRRLGVIEERNRIAREIHDTLAQNLTGIVLQLEAAQQLQEYRPERAWERVEKALGLAVQGLDDVRRSVRNLRPAPLEQRSLRQALSDELHRVESDTGAHVESEIETDLPSLPPPVEDALFRIGQEAFNNVRRHAAASQVRLSLDAVDGWVRLRVRDNGRGFRNEAGEAPSRTFGLTSMRERARLIGGDLEIKSMPNRGTLITARAPLHTPENDRSGDDL